MLASMIILFPALAGCASVVQGPTGTPTPDPLAAAQELFATYCAECHGPLGEGHAIPSAPALDASEHAWHHPDWQLRMFIRDGKFSFSPVEMPSFRDELIDEQIDLVIAYVKTLWTQAQRETQEDMNRRSILPTATP